MVTNGLIVEGEKYKLEGTSNKGYALAVKTMEEPCAMRLTSIFIHIH